MVGINVNGPTKDQVLKFITEKDNIEREIQELHAVLETNNVGMTDALVDQEGYPRNDIDVYRVRHARHRIICLQNEHKELMKQIEKGLHVIHSEIRGLRPQESGTSRQPMDTAQPNGHTNGYTNGHGNGNGISNGHSMETDGEDPRLASVVQGTRDLRVGDRAIVKVNFVSAGSPADNAGIRVDDEILGFGSVNATNFNNLSQIADIVQYSVGTRVDVRLRRGDAVLNIALTPNPWAGRGLLGCNIVPI